MSDAQNYYLVITQAGAEPMAVCAPDVLFIRDELPTVALIAKTSKSMLLAAGWTEETIHRGHMADLGRVTDRPLRGQEGAMSAPIPMRIHCPGPRRGGGICGELHVDEGEFATKPHHTHACQFCGHVFRPAVEPTVGVRFLPGFKNEEALVPGDATERECGLGGAHEWEGEGDERCCRRCVMAWADRFVDIIAYQETKATVARALERADHGNDKDAVVGALHAVEDWAKRRPS